MTLASILLAAGVFASSGLIALLTPRGSRLGDRLFAAMMAAGALLGAPAALAVLVQDRALELTASWLVPWGRVWLRADALGAAFLLPVFVVPALGAIYATGYWRDGHSPGARSLRVFYGLLAGSMAVVVLARDGVLFLVAWEVMALSAFFAIATEDSRSRVRRAAWVYFVATHLGTLALIALFALIRSVSGAFDFSPLPAGLAPPLATAIFLVGLVGFGLKAGIMPLHVWLPGAHANAPSHVSAVLSGVMLKMGVYGIFRLCSMLPETPPWHGWVVLWAGACSAVLGIALAVGQQDSKRLLAYSSIENIGVIFVGLGAALLGRALGDPALSGLALAGAVLHVWNHALFKPLLFLCAGNVLHSAGTRRIDRLGGLGRAMPWTMGLACLGCVAIASLPPLNGFVGEWLIYRGLLHRLDGAGGEFSAGVAAAIIALALTGALALVAFVRFLGVPFLGVPRSDAARRAHEAAPVMLAPAIVLGALCIALGVLPSVVAPCVAPVVRIVTMGEGAQQLQAGLLAPLRPIGVASACLLGVGLAAAVALRRWSGADAAPRAGTWDCGYARPSGRMQYSGSSLSQLLVGLFAWVLLPRRRVSGIRSPFPGPARHRAEVPDAVLDRVVRPGLGLLSRAAAGLRLLQPGKIQVYMLYILAAVLALLVMVVR